MSDTSPEIDNEARIALDLMRRCSELLQQLPDDQTAVDSRLEGENLSKILQPLGLPPVMIAAVQLYPGEWLAATW